jgi:hypothetical protein
LGSPVKEPSSERPFAPSFFREKCSI